MDTHQPFAPSDPYTVRGLLSRIKAEENRRVKDVAALTFQLNQQKKKNQKLENEAKLERDKRRFKENEIVHLKLALDRAYDTIDRLEKKAAECERDHVHVQELDKSEEKIAIVQAKLLERESHLFEAEAKVEDVCKAHETLRRDHLVVKAKYEQLLRSEHALAVEVRALQMDLDTLKQANERRAELVGSLNSGDREETIKTLLRVGKNLPRSRYACLENTKQRQYHGVGLQDHHPAFDGGHRHGRLPKFDQDVLSDDDGSIGAMSL